MSLHVFGIRHHGPGCARSLVAALDELQPDVLVVEGPADAQEAITLAGHEQMRPPVAMLIYPDATPEQAVYYPLMEYSPEWQAFRWAARQGIPVRLMDLPMQHRLSLDMQAATTEKTPPIEPVIGPVEQDESLSPPTSQQDQPWRTDPIALLAEAAGFRDHELWWEEQVERRADAAGLFEAILEAMRTVREECPEVRPADLLREAWMRRTIREVTKEGHDRIAVICGAWHSPVLDEPAVHGKRDGLRSKDDGALLKGLPKLKTTATWIPWTSSRLTYRSGYGAGVTSPGWYAHVWASPQSAPVRWVATAARLLREKDLDASSASVIEAVRLADALAAIRELRSPGLAELNEAILTVLCHGQTAPLRLIREHLEIGHDLGEVPDDAPAVPLALDLARLQKSLRLKPTTEIKVHDFDLRNATDLARSQLLHRLLLLDIPWGQNQHSGMSTSTFHDVWQLQWQPEFAVRIIEANVWGNTVAAAASARVVYRAEHSPNLREICDALNECILAGLPEAVGQVLMHVQARAALATDVGMLMEALPSLARVARYGDVRGTESHHILPIIVGLFERIVVGLSAACSSLDDEAAEGMLKHIGEVQQALDLLQREDLKTQWQERLRKLAESNLNGLIRGWSTRLLLEQGQLASGELDRLTRVALSPTEQTTTAAAWISGFLRGSGLVLLQQDAFWSVFDRWLAELTPDAFTELLPLLRRAFADFSPAERREMGRRVKRLDSTRSERSPVPVGADGSLSSDLDVRRASKVLPVLRTILGVAERSGS